MKYVKLFENFTNEEVSYQNPNGKMIATHTFGADEHLDFCETVSEWIEKNKKPVLWCLYAKPTEGDNEESFGLGVKQAETFWKMYVNGDKRFSLVEMDGRLIGVLHGNGTIEKAFDEADVKVDPSVLSGLEF